MSRTFRNNTKRRGSFSRWVNARDEKGDSKPFSSRFKSVDGKIAWRCRCEDYCIAGKLHKHRRHMHPVYDGEVEDGLLHRFQADHADEETSSD